MDMGAGCTYQLVKALVADQVGIGRLWLGTNLVFQVYFSFILLKPFMLSKRLNILTFNLGDAIT